MMDDPDDKKPENWVEEKRIVDEKVTGLRLMGLVAKGVTNWGTLVYELMMVSHLCCCWSRNNGTLHIHLVYHGIPVYPMYSEFDKIPNSEG